MHVCMYVRMNVPTHHLILHVAFFNKASHENCARFLVPFTVSPVTHTSTSLLKACKCNVVTLQ